MWGKSTKKGKREREKRRMGDREREGEKKKKNKEKQKKQKKKTRQFACVCERACVHKVPPCKCLIVCVGNNSPIPQGMKQARKRPGPQTSRDPQGTGPPGEPPQGQPRPPPRKGQRRARRRDLRQPQCRRPRVPWRQARRLHRQPTTPGRTGPWARRPKGPPPHNRGPARPVGPGPA